MKNKERESNCEVLQTENHDQFRQIAPIDADKAAAKEYTEWEQGRKGGGTK